MASTTANDLPSVSMPVSTSSGNVSAAVSISSSASSSSSVLSHSSSASSAEKKDKTGTKPAKKERLPRIQLKKIEGSAEGPVVECSFDTYKNNRIIFKFGLDEDEPDEVAENMVCLFEVFCSSLFLSLNSTSCKFIDYSNGT